MNMRIDPDFIWHPRVEWHPDPVVRDSHGNPRPALPTPVNRFVVHHTGAGQWADPGDTADELRGIEEWAKGQGKPNEYNSSSDFEANGWEYAGPFRAAHCTDWNSDTWGHLALYNGVTEDPNDALIHGIIQTRHKLVSVGWMMPGHEMWQHKQSPCGLATGTTCPYDLSEEPWWSRVSAPLDFTPPPPADTWDPPRSYGNWPTKRRKPKVRYGDVSDAAMYAEAVMHHSLPPFCIWFATIHENKAKAATKDYWRQWHLHRAGQFWRLKDLVERLVVDRKYGPVSAQAVVLMKQAFEGKRIGGHKLDFEGKSEVGGEVWRFLDAVSDGAW